LSREWHVVRSSPGAEGRALIGIQAAGMTGFLPVELLNRNHRGEREVMWRALFPGHLFAAIDPGRDLPKLREIDGVDDVVRPGGRLAPIAEDTIAAIRRAERQGTFDGAGACRILDDGEAQVPEGSLASLVSKIRSARWSKRRMEVLMTLPQY
jgi:hypothetical protein